jgi:hypothetical protein
MDPATAGNKKRKNEDFLELLIKEFAKETDPEKRRKILDYIEYIEKTQ